MKSREQLVLGALHELGVVASGQSAEAEDAQTVDALVEPMFANLATREVWQWGDPDQIDDDAFIYLAKWLANSVARPFGATPDENVRLLAEQSLRELKPIFLSGQPQTTEYF